MLKVLVSHCDDLHESIELWHNLQYSLQLICIQGSAGWRLICNVDGILWVDRQLHSLNMTECKEYIAKSEGKSR